MNNRMSCVLSGTAIDTKSTTIAAIKSFLILAPPSFFITYRNINVSKEKIFVLITSHRIDSDGFQHLNSFHQVLKIDAAVTNDAKLFMCNFLITSVGYVAKHILGT